MKETTMLLCEADTAATKIHIVFGDSMAGSLKLAIKQQGDAETSKVISIYDRFSIGPLWQLDEEVGRLNRSQWFRDNINDGYDDVDNDGAEAYYRILTEQMARIPDRASIVVWSGDNAYEQVGLRYAVYLLKNCRNRLIVFNAGEACNRKFNHSDQSIVYSHTGEIPHEKLQVILGEIEQGGPIAYETRQLLEHEWLSLAKQHDVLRIWDGEQILNVDENYFEYRLRKLINKGELEIEGVPRAIRYYSVRRK